MRGHLDHLESDFRGRISVPRALTGIAIRWPRLLLAALLAVVPALLLFLVTMWAPPAFAKALTDTQNVHGTFARFVNGIATASSIAVSVAALTLRRDLHGLRSHEERHETNEAYRDRVRARLGAKELPVGLGAFLAVLLDGITRRAATAREVVREQGGEHGEVVEYLESLEMRARVAAQRARESQYAPDDLLIAALDFEHEVSARLAHRYARQVPPPARAHIEELRDLLSDFVLAQKFQKTLDTQWGLSRMSAAILLSTLPSIVTAALMVLTYGDGARDALGEMGAAALVCGAFAVVLFPLACFVSYILRFLVVNAFTLPTDGFLLGPEARPLRGRGDD